MARFAQCRTCGRLFMRYWRARRHKHVICDSCREKNERSLKDTLHFLRKVAGHDDTRR